MINKIIPGTIQLRRDNAYNYERIKTTYIPLKGEIVLVDTANDGLRIKVGDGNSTYAALPFADANLIAQIQNIIVQGYYYNGKFYKDNAHTQEIQGVLYRLYIDIVGSKTYIYNNEYIELNKLPSATSTIAGIMKLYNEHGDNIDGTMTQSAITNADTALSNRIDTKFSAKIDDSDEELLILYK